MHQGICMDTNELMTKLEKMGAEDVVQKETTGREFGKTHQSVRALFPSNRPSSKLSEIESNTEWDLVKEDSDLVTFSREKSI